MRPRKIFCVESWPLYRSLPLAIALAIVPTIVPAIVPDMPGPTSKASRDLAQVRFQFKSGKTRKGRPLEPEEITALEEKRDRMVAEMRAERQKKFICRITDHTTSEADCVIREVPQVVQQCIAEELDKRLGPAPATELEEALVARDRNNKRIRELRKEEKKAARIAACPPTEPAQEQPETRSVPRALTTMGGARRIRDDLDIWVIPHFAEQVLGFDPAALMTQLQSYPKVKAGQNIAPGAAQWVEGENKAFNYRGGPVRRNKVWFQRGDPKSVGTRRYLYIGWQWDVLCATADVRLCPEVALAADRHDAWAEREGYPSANLYCHGI